MAQQIYSKSVTSQLRVLNDRDRSTTLKDTGIRNEGKLRAALLGEIISVTLPYYCTHHRLIVYSILYPHILINVTKASSR